MALRFSRVSLIILNSYIKEGIDTPVGSECLLAFGHRFDYREVCQPGEVMSYTSVSNW